MIWLGTKLNNDYAWELCMFHKLRTFRDGIGFFEFKVNWDRYLDDHTPRFETMLTIFNFVIVDFSIYYRWHRDGDETEQVFQEVLNEELSDNPEDKEHPKT